MMPKLVPILSQDLMIPITEEIHDQILVCPSMLDILQTHWKSMAEMRMDHELSIKLSDYHMKRNELGFPWNTLFCHIHGL